MGSDQTLLGILFRIWRTAVLVQAAQTPPRDTRMYVISSETASENPIYIYPCAYRLGSDISECWMDQYYQCAQGRIWHRRLRGMAPCHDDDGSCDLGNSIRLYARSVFQGENIYVKGRGHLRGRCD
jgi:hypothetical protein